MLTLPMACIVFTNDEPAEIYLVKHTYELNSDATTAMQTHVTKWLLTAEGRRFLRNHDNSHNVSFWAALFEQHSEMLAKTPGILAIELLPCHPMPVYEEDDTTSPWYHDYRYDPNSPLPQPMRAIRKLDKDKLRWLLTEENQHAEQHG